MNTWSSFNKSSLCTTCSFINTQHILHSVTFCYSINVKTTIRIIKILKTQKILYMYVSKTHTHTLSVCVCVCECVCVALINRTNQMLSHEAITGPLDSFSALEKPAGRRVGGSPSQTLNTPTSYSEPPPTQHSNLFFCFLKQWSLKKTKMIK